MSILPYRLLILTTALVLIIPLVIILLPVQQYGFFLPLFDGSLTKPIGATLGGIATPLLLLAGILLAFEALRKHKQTNLFQYNTKVLEKERVHGEVATRYILELFALFNQENNKFSTEEVEKVLKTVAETHQNFHNGQIPLLTFTSHLRDILNTSAVGQHLHHITKLLTQLIKLVRNKQVVLPPEEYGLMVSFLDGFNAAICPKIQALGQLNHTCNLCTTNPYKFFLGQDQIVALNKALESINIKPYKI